MIYFGLSCRIQVKLIRNRCLHLPSGPAKQQNEHQLHQSLSVGLEPVLINKADRLGGPSHQLSTTPPAFCVQRGQWVQGYALAPCIPNLKGWKWNYCICLEVDFYILEADPDYYTPFVLSHPIVLQILPGLSVLLIPKGKKRWVCGGVSYRVTEACCETLKCFFFVSFSWKVWPSHKLIAIVFVIMCKYI